MAPGLEAAAKRVTRKGGPRRHEQGVRSELPIAVRVYPDLPSSRTERGPMPPIDAMLVFDCETRTDKAQALTFGSYRFFVAGRCIQEGLFYGDDLLPREKRVLERFIASHPAETDPRGIPERDIPGDPALHLLSVAQFRERCTASGTRAARCSSLSTSRLNAPPRTGLHRVARPLLGGLQLYVLPVSGYGRRYSPEPVPADADNQTHG